MAQYSQFIGLRVDVRYRSAGFILPAAGRLVGDTGRSVFLEEHYVQEGKPSTFRWEIPYQYILSLNRGTEPDDSPAAADPIDASTRNEGKPVRAPIPFRKRPSET
jgi:hypothetical protein